MTFDKHTIKPYQNPDIQQQTIDLLNHLIGTGVAPAMLMADLVNSRTTFLNFPGFAFSANPCVFLGFNIINPNVYPVYVKIYDTYTLMPGTTVPNMTLLVPAGGSIYQEANSVQLNCANALRANVTKLLSDTDITPVASDLVMNVKYVSN